ncbi:acyl-CoA dehydrogenase family protein [Qaidamihabitans albus]|uniref:acyl-CoA dehydrogenase family protein n=1 Tax=Qaidamihabitans albus TaxID=2795733 RepID=UPI0018F143F4|nr:acyl-CoA dehydrogenase [Qaidamihabitans albus]
MDFYPTRTQADLKATARRYLDDRYPLERVAQLCQSGTPHEHWTELAELGWLDAELGTVELALIAEETGRTLAPALWYAAAGAALPCYRAAGVEPHGPVAFAGSVATCDARNGGERWALHGRLALVPGSRSVGEIVVAASTADGPALFAISSDGPGVAVLDHYGVDSIDPLRRQADVELSAAPARLLAADPDGRLLGTVTERTGMMLASEGVGVAERGLELAVDHATNRVQFGKPIGSYQAVAHPLAEAYADVELARSLVYRAACVLQDGPGGEAEVAAAVHASTRCAVSVCETAVQTFGGTGVTWEFPLHWWYRRALWLDAHLSRTGPLDTIADTVLG